MHFWSWIFLCSDDGRVVELVDTPALGAGGATRESSSLSSPTICTENDSVDVSVKDEIGCEPAIRKNGLGRFFLRGVLGE